jgi:hypothetical protein
MAGLLDELAPLPVQTAALTERVYLILSGTSERSLKKASPQSSEQM